MYDIQVAVHELLHADVLVGSESFAAGTPPSPQFTPEL